MANIFKFDARQILTLISFYSNYPQWKLIERIIELESENKLKDILEEYNG
jgi:hypothetical protein